MAIRAQHTVLLITTGESSNDIDIDDFQNALNFVCVELAKMIARDGEGATKMMEVTVAGARNRADAIKAAKAVVRSPLVKTALFGADPNWAGSSLLLAILVHSWSQRPCHLRCQMERAPPLYWSKTAS